MKSAAYDVAIAGGGFAGLVTATALARHGARVCVIEPQIEGVGALRGELLHARGVRSLENLGLADAVHAAGSVPVEGFAAYAPRSETPVRLGYSNGRGIGIEHHALVSALRGGAARYPNVELKIGQRAVDVIRQSGRVIGVRCANGEEVYAPLVVGADGRHSKLRKALGIPTSIELLSHTVAATIAGDALPEARHGHVFVGAVGPVLAYPFSRDSVRVQLDVSIRAAQESGGLIPYLVREYLPHVAPSLREPIRAALLGRPLMAVANHAIYTEYCVTPGAALVGDATGCSHPLTASGMTIALADAECLGAQLSKHGATDQALLEYQRSRNAFVRARETFGHALYEVFRAEEEGLRRLRDAVFEYWRSPRARRASMDILSAEESTMRVFVSEYLRVVGVAARNTTPTSAGVEPLVELLVSAGRSMSFATDRVLTRIAHDRMRKLLPFPIDDTFHVTRAKKPSAERLRILLREHSRSGARRLTPTFLDS